MHWRDHSVDYVWHPNNIIIKGKLNIVHLLLFLIMCCLFFGIMSSIFLTMYYSHMSDINVGVITTIWSVQPLIAAFLDWIFYRQRLGLNHIIGMILVILGAVAIGFAGIFKLQESKYHAPNHIPEKPVDNNSLAFHPVIKDPKGSSYTWVAIIWGFITPCFFLAQSFFTKFITQPKYGFNARTASLGTSSFTSFLVLILGVVWYWRTVQPFDSKLFLIGIVGSILDTIGKSFIQTAFATGPAGPVTAFVEMNNVLLIVLDSLRTFTFPSALEIIGFVLGITGGMCFVF